MPAGLLRRNGVGGCSCGGRHHQFLFWKVWHPGPNSVPSSLFHSTYLLSAYCVPSRKQVRGYHLVTCTVVCSEVSIGVCAHMREHGLTTARAKEQPWSWYGQEKAVGPVRFSLDFGVNSDHLRPEQKPLSLPLHQGLWARQGCGVQWFRVCALASPPAFKSRLSHLLAL